MSERFSFLPSFGFALAAGIALYRLFNSGSRVVAIALTSIIVLGFTGWTLARSRVWKDNHTLFTSDIHTSKNSAKLLNAMGGDLVTSAENEKNPELKRRKLVEAQEYLKRAQKIHPNYKLSYLLLGNSHFHLGELDQAITYYRHVYKMDPAYGEGRRNLGVAL